MTMCHQEADLAACAISLNHERSQVVDFLAPHSEDKYVIAVKHTSNKWHYFTHIYTRWTWLAIFLCPLGIVLTTRLRQLFLACRPCW